MNETLCRIALHQADFVGPVTGKSLISYCGNAEEVFRYSKAKLRKIPSVGPVISEGLHRPELMKKAEKELDFILRNNIQMLFYSDDCYPSRLKHQNDSPLLLFYKGNVDLNLERSLAIVGTRNMTSYGRDLTEQLVEDLKEYGVLIISGLAFGIDTIAHRTALSTGLNTVGVLGHGFDRMYPEENEILARNMLEQGGLLTEFCSGTKPDKQNFPMRNRIVAGLADATVVIESKAEGGSLITAELANQYHKDVFAFPGKISDHYSAGCNLLIKHQKAQLIESAMDLLQFMNWSISTKVTQPQNESVLFHELSEEESLVYTFIKNKEKVHIDLLVQSLNFTPGFLTGILLNLQINGLVKAHPGKTYSCV